MKIKVVKDSRYGSEFLVNFLYSLVDGKTVLFLSGGRTPQEAYSKLALEQKINPGAVAMVDERYGRKMHKNSNEEMIRGTGFLSYLAEKKIPFLPILRLHPKGVAWSLARDYNKEVKHLLAHFSKSIAIMGIGSDGHTGGLPPGSKNSKLKMQNYVTEVNNFPGEFKERISLTFSALSKMDLLIVLAFGEEKKGALKKMFEKGPIEEIPARFYAKPEIAKKTILITDQKI